MFSLKKLILPKDWTHQDTLWVFSMFGTAVGAGVLFLPINAGMSGFWPLMIMTVLVWKMTFLAHRGLSRLVHSSKQGNTNITEVVKEHFGPLGGQLITLLYFFAIYPIVLIYGVGVTNTAEYFITQQLALEAPPRIWLSLLLILSMMFVMWRGEKVMLKVTEWLVYPLVVFLLIISFYLIPYWNLTTVYQKPCLNECLKTLWLTIPVLIFSFNHSPIISSFTQAQVRDYGEESDKKISQILNKTATMLLGFVMFFVFSCVLSLNSEDLLEAKRMNITILSYLSNKYQTPLLSYFGSPIALLAILSSFFGHYLGAKEGLVGLLTNYKKRKKQTAHKKSIDRAVSLFLLLSLWLTAYLNPSILGMIETLSGPIIAIVLFILPIYAIYRVPTMKKYRNQKFSNLFVLVMGLIAISSIFYRLI